MNELEKDIYYTQHLNEGSPYYSGVYFSTNEHLDKILINFDIKDKKVLTCVGSGDQAFHFINYGAKSVDLFDINKLTFYYYYLRVWTIRYLNKSYPSYYLDNHFIKELLSLVDVKTSDELLAYNYWKLFVDIINQKCSDFLFLPSFLDVDRKIYDNTSLAKRLECLNTHFYNFDISKKVNINEKYDIIYTSNISEYFDNDIKLYKTYRNNLNVLLNKNGIVVCSNVVSDDKNKLCEDVMKRYFKRYDLDVSDDSYPTNVKSLCYYYKKRSFQFF